MKGKVLVPFIDKHTLKGYSVGNVYESDDLKRIAFLSEQGYIKANKTEKPKRPRKNKAGE
jgi:hypothetical protein